MSNFDFLFGTNLRHLVLRQFDSLSRVLQLKDMSESEGQHNASLTLETLENLRTEEEFDSFWDKIQHVLDCVDVNEPSLPRRRKVPRRFEEGIAAPEYPATAKDLYRQVYFEALDLVTACIKDWFDQWVPEHTAIFRTFY